jgi:CHAT domain-containing protein
LSPEGPDGFRVRGLWELVWHNWNPRSLDRAIDDLERAAESGSADALNDLAVAYFERSRSQDRALDLLRSLRTLERARSMAPGHHAVAFNKAVVLDAFSLSRGSRVAWETYLELDPESPWSVEARTALAAAEQRVAESRNRGREARLPKLLEGDSRVTAETARADPQIAREAAYGPILERWVDAASEAEADRVIARLRWMGQAVVDGSIEGLADLLEAAGGDRTSSIRWAAERYLEAADLLGRGRPDDAARAYEEAASTPDLGVLGEWARLGAGAAYFGLGDYAKALRFPESVRVRADETRTPALVGRSHWMSGLIANRRGLHGEGWRNLDRAVDLYEIAGEVENSAWVHTLRAEALTFTGRHEEAWQDRIAALGILDALPAGPRLARVLTEAGTTAARLDMVEAALAFQESSVQVASVLDLPPVLAEALARRAKLRQQAGLESGALSDLARARAIGPSIPDAESRAIVSRQIWEVEAEILRQEQPLLALEAYDSLIAHHEARDNGIELAGSYLRRGLGHQAVGTLDRYAEDLDRAVDLIERQAADLTDPVRTASFAATADEVFDEAVRHWALDLDDPRGALEFEERRRRLVLRSSPGSGPLPIGSRLPAGTVVLEYAVLDDRVVRWEIRRGGVSFHTSEGTPEELAGVAAEFTQALRERSEAVDPLGRELHRLLGLSALDLQGDNSRLIVIPDGFLNQLPFAALVDPDSGEFLVEGTAVAVAPHLGFLTPAQDGPRLRPGSDGGSALLVGAASVDPMVLPSLVATPWSSTELEDLAELYPTETVLVGDAANRSMFVRGLADATVLHYAGHAVHDPLEPETSHLVLTASDADGPADLLLARELDPRAMPLLRLVVLSACSSAAPTRDAGGGFWGLAHPFLRAGADAVVGTLWAADDRAARELQMRFHEAWLGGQDSAEALQAAQIELIRHPDPRMSAPRAWAAFQTIGIAW